MIDSANKPPFLLVVTVLVLLLSAFFTYHSRAQESYVEQSLWAINVSSNAQNAINNGVPVTFNVEYAQRTDFLFWTYHSKNKVTAYVVCRHALSSRYTVTSEDDERPEIFNSIAKSLDFIASQALDLLHSKNDQTESKNNKIEMRVSINKYELPSPIRLKAFLSDDWDIDSQWIE